MGGSKRRRLMGRTPRLPRNANGSRARPLARGRWQQRGYERATPPDGNTRRLRRRNPHANHATTQRTRRSTDMEESKQVPSFWKKPQVRMLSEAMSDLNGTLTARFTSVDGAVDSGMSENSSYVWNGEVTNFPLSPVRMAFSGKVAVKRT